MIKVKPNTKVFVYVPVDVVTGGAELLHQLVDTLNNHDVEAYIVYFRGNMIVDNEIPQAYAKYNIKVSKNIEDIEDNIIVIYEGIFDKIYDTKKIQKILWWLSVDHFYIYSSNFLSLRDGLSWSLKFGLKQTYYRVGRFILRREPIKGLISLKKLSQIQALHCYQSEYAQNFLLNKGFNELLPLSDFINTDFITLNRAVLEKEDKILYNPKKGMKITSKLMNIAPNLKWVPLINMTRDEMIHELQTAKVYIDFGYHPGKDRIPREAAICGCCVITNKEGSANFFEDVSIDEKYKYSEKNFNPSKIIEKIEYIFSNYDEASFDFDFYRKRISNEKELFIKEVLSIFIR